MGQPRKCSQVEFLHRNSDGKAGNKAATVCVLNAIDSALAIRGQAHMLLGGGKSPLKLHETLLADARSKRLNWSRVHVWVSDERMVPFEHPGSNAGMIWRTLCSPLGMRREQLHAPDPEVVAELASAGYDHELTEFFEASGEMDLSVLGVGEDGHTASLFPGGPWVGLGADTFAMAVGKGPDGYERVSILPGALLRTRRILLLVNTPAKRAARAIAESREYDPARYPLQILREAEMRLTVLE